MFRKYRINGASKVLAVTLFACGMLLSQGCEAKGWEKFKSFFKPKEITKNAGVTEEDYKSFEVIMKMHKIVDKERRKAKKYGVDVCSGRKACPSPNPYYHQTKKGFFIEGHDCLHTPFGEVTLTHGGSYSGYGWLAFRQSLFKRLETKFSHICHRGAIYSGDKPLKYRVLKSNDTDLKTSKKHKEVFNEAPYEEISKMKGKDVLMSCSNYCGQEPVYELLEVDGQKLPEPVLQPHANYRKSDDVKAVWETMEKRFKREKRLKPLLFFLRWCKR